ncbi:LEM domain-containing protein Bocksbeutel [Drosophila nasuta]|uniref:LEM domain-containing protein Bocksbeutel n=1 Tax=Drosophila nasuta TaxID=42062 RepID=UPI00295E5622|nr:LEM domain-containing protein Bocksbeutel [Drosophila nasuta]
MSDLSYLDTISNKELHAKCLQHGLPNIPVTDSSRQVILRRLRSAILGVPLNKSKNNSAAASKKKAPRRETVHSSNVTPAAETVQRVAGKSPSRNNNNNTRRTIAATAGNYYPLGNVSTRSVETTTTVSDLGSQSEDDDYYTNRPQYNEVHRPVSLGKSELLTTSYTRGIEGQETQYSVDDEPQTYTYQRPHVASTLPGYQQDRTYSSGLARNQNLTHSLLNSTSYNEDATDYNKVEPQRYSYNGSAAPFQSAAASTSSATSTIRQRQTMGSVTGFGRGRLIQPTYRINTLYPQLNEFYDQATNADESMEVDTDSEPEVETQQQQQRSYGRQPVESPYLSSFSRQLDAGKRSSPLARPQKRATLANEDALDSPMTQFRGLFRSLDQRYHLKFYFCLMLAVMFTTLVYVLLTP